MTLCPAPCLPLRQSCRGMWTETRRPHPLPQRTGHEVCLHPGPDLYYLFVSLLAAVVVVVLFLCLVFCPGMLSWRTVYFETRSFSSSSAGAICHYYKKKPFRCWETWERAPEHQCLTFHYFFAPVAEQFSREKKPLSSMIEAVCAIN